MYKVQGLHSDVLLFIRLTENSGSGWLSVTCLSWLVYFAITKLAATDQSLVGRVSLHRSY